MTGTEIMVLCRSLCLLAVPGPCGVEFVWYFDAFPRAGERIRFRIQRGSGIAGKASAWNVYEMPAGPALGPKVRSKRALRRQILAAIVEGERPPDRDGYQTYARWHTFGYTSSVQWYQRRVRRLGI